MNYCKTILALYTPYLMRTHFNPRKWVGHFSFQEKDKERRTPGTYYLSEEITFEEAQVAFNRMLVIRSSSLPELYFQGVPLRIEMRGMEL